MGDFTAVRSFVYVTGNTIDPAQNNGNENEVYNKHNGAMNGSTGHTHSGSTGDGPPVLALGDGAVMNSQPILRVLSTTGGINGKLTGATNLYTVPTGKTAVIVGATIRLTTATAISGTLGAGVGVAAGEDDIFASTTITGLDATGEAHVFWAAGMRKLATAAQVVKLGIDAAFGGTTATLEVALIGYLF